MDSGKQRINNTDSVGAAMVAGAGIAGMQAALDLGNSGFKVYLVEESAAIGGRMSQLDKTFPTNDCAMCTISPKLIEVDKHPNIEILTRTKILSLDGEPGRFKARVEKAPRFVDLELCNACGDCLDVCPVSTANNYEQDLVDRKAIYKQYPQAIPNTFAIEKNARPPCVQTCPAGVNCQGYLALTSDGKFAEAAKLIFDRNPFLSICGRVCHHPCEEECHRREFDEAVAINPVKRFLGDWALSHPEEMKKVFEDQRIDNDQTKMHSNKNNKIAVIGSGPAGLTASLDLVQQGYNVSVFEASSDFGGMLRTGFPDFRLPQDVMGAEVQRILDFGIGMELNTKIGEDLSIQDLKDRGYKAVYVAIGLQVGRTLNIDGNECEGVYDGLRFLHQVNVGEPTGIGKNVLVIGGGNVAIDVAITAGRAGADNVKLVCLESRDGMPAHDWEIVDAEGEDVEILNSWGPVEINGHDRVTGLTVKRCQSVLDEAGRFNPVFDESVKETISADTVIFAIGQGIEREIVERLGLKLNGQGTIKVDDVTFETNLPGVFAGGDAIRIRSSVVEAVAFGHEAAISIDRFIHGEDLYEGRVRNGECAEVPEKKIDRVPRVKEKRTNIEKRKGNFSELTVTITEEEAVKEAKRCLNCGICSECLQCFYICQPKAIFHDMKPEVLEIDIGALIIATGFDPFDAHGSPEYGYGRYPNVLTSLEYERILSASGPFSGEITRPSDLKKPGRIAWIQCVGSRDQRCGREYCSSVCCMYATKQSIVTKEHSNGNIKASIFYNDIRAFGKGFERYYTRAEEELGVEYIRCIVSSIKQLEQSKDLIVKYIDNENRVIEEIYDLVVLSVGIIPSSSGTQLYNKLGLSTDKYGFCETESFRSSKTSREGVFICGAGEAPKDIPESVIQASSAAALVGELLSDSRGNLIVEKTYPDERTIVDEDPRIGVFVCHCGTNIARVIDVEALVDFATILPHVVHAERNIYTCSTDTQKTMIETIKEKRINRVVVSSCTPRTLESLFQNTIREAGLNKYLFEMANIRDQCSWVHAATPELALEKAKDLVAMAVKRAETLEPLHELEFKINKSTLVIGGGAAGMTAALSLAEQGFHAYLLEKTDSLGGNLKNVSRLLDGTETSDFLESLIRRVESHPDIDIYKNAEVLNFNGHVGEFQTVISRETGEMKLEHGAIIFATGGREYQPVEYHYGESDLVLTQLDFEKVLTDNPERVRNLKTIVMIQCVGSREEPQNYCSRLCCQEAVKNALRVKEISPDVIVYVLYRDIRTYGFNELFYLEARKNGVIFIRYDKSRKPETIMIGNKLKVNVYDTSSGETLEFPADRLILSAGIRPPEDLGTILQKYKAPVNQDGFLLEAHMKLRPLDFANEGMFMAGLAHGPKLLSESLVQAYGAASRAITILSNEMLRISGIVAIVDEERCAACLTCVRVCPYDIPKLNENNRAFIDPASCQGCGTCAGACPAKAIEVLHYKDKQIVAKCDALEILGQLEHV